MGTSDYGGKAVCLALWELVWEIGAVSGSDSQAEFSGAHLY